MFNVNWKKVGDFAMAAGEKILYGVAGAAVYEGGKYVGKKAVKAIKKRKNGKKSSSSKATSNKRTSGKRRRAA